MTQRRIMSRLRIKCFSLASWVDLNRKMGKHFESRVNLIQYIEWKPKEGQRNQVKALKMLTKWIVDSNLWVMTWCKLIFQIFWVMSWFGSKSRKVFWDMSWFESTCSWSFLSLESIWIKFQKSILSHELIHSCKAVVSHELSRIKTFWHQVESNQKYFKSYPCLLNIQIASLENMFSPATWKKEGIRDSRRVWSIGIIYETDWTEGKSFTEKRL